MFDQKKLDRINFLAKKNNKTRIRRKRSIKKRILRKL